MSTDIGVWIGALLTLCLYSFLYKENRFYQFAERLYVGVGAGYYICQGLNNVINKAWDPMVKEGKIYLIIPMVLGLMLYCRFVKSLVWVSRIPLSILVGIGVGLVLRGSIVAEFSKQIGATMLPLNSIRNIIIVFGCLGVLSYFYFSRTQNRGPMYNLSLVGRWLMMITFGAAFGNTVQGRISLFISRLQYLFGDWLGIIK